jgi:hypothetical protein
MSFNPNDLKRNPNSPEQSWPFWIVPSFAILDYSFKVLFVLFIIPWLFGLTLTVLGMFTNFLLIDYIVYRHYKSVEII